MSISSEITRISNAKNDIITAIEKRGGSVEDGTRVDGLAKAIMDLPRGVKINGSESIRTNISNEKISAGSLIEIADTASANISEIRSDLTHTFDEYTNLLVFKSDQVYQTRKVIITPYPYTLTDYGFLIDFYEGLQCDYEPIKKFLTPVLFKLNSSTSILALKQIIHTAALPMWSGENYTDMYRFVVAVFGSFTAQGIALTNYQVRLFVFEIAHSYSDTKLTMIDQIFTFDSNAYMPLWTNNHYNGCGPAERPYYYSMVTPIDSNRFMIPVRYGSSSANKVGIVVFTVENGAIQAHSTIVAKS